MVFNVGDKIKINNPGHKIHNLKGIVIGASRDLIHIKLENGKRFGMNKRYLINETEEYLTRKCLFENYDALDECETTWNDIPDDIKELVEIGVLTREEVIAKCTNNICTEGEKTTMKEIKNQKVVDLYFERKVRELKKKLDEDIKAVESQDPNKSFVSELRKQFETYVTENDLNTESKNIVIQFGASLPCTDTSSKAIKKLRDESLDAVEKVHEEKNEVLTMLSGCETYDQKMVVLNSYGIVNYDKHDNLVAKMN